MQETILKIRRQYPSHPVYEETTSFPPYEDLKIPDMLFTSQKTPHITLGNEQCLKLLMEFATLKVGAISLYLWREVSH
jgi:hypothetical protein